MKKMNYETFLREQFVEVNRDLVEVLRSLERNSVKFPVHTESTVASKTYRLFTHWGQLCLTVELANLGSRVKICAEVYRHPALDWPETVTLHNGCILNNGTPIAMAKFTQREGLAMLSVIRKWKLRNFKGEKWRST